MDLLSSCNEPVRLKYRTTFLSRATFFNLIIVVLAIAGPYLIAYRTQGFWTKVDLVREQPIVHFKHEVLLILDTKLKDGSRDQLIWTTFPGLATMLTQTVSPGIMTREADHNMDGINEHLEIEITVKLKEEKVYGVHLFLLFNYQLLKFATLQMESMAYIRYESAHAGNHLEQYSDLALVYKQPLWNRVRDTRFDKPVIPRVSTTVSDYDIGNILREYSRRNMSTILRNKYGVWREDSTHEREFVLQAVINYPETSYECWAGFWNTLKWAWVQYFAIFVLVASVLRKFQQLVYRSQLFESMIDVPWQKRHGFNTVPSK